MFLQNIVIIKTYLNINSFKKTIVTFNYLYCTSIIKLLFKRKLIIILIMINISKIATHVTVKN